MLVSACGSLLCLGTVRDSLYRFRTYILQFECKARRWSHVFIILGFLEDQDFAGQGCRLVGWYLIEIRSWVKF